MCAKEKARPSLTPVEAIANELTAGVERYPDVFFIHQPDQVTNVKVRKKRYLISTQSGISLEIRIYSATIIRFRYAITGEFEPDFSYALDPAFKASKITTQHKEKKKTIEIETSLLKCVISKIDLSIKLFDREDGRLILADQSPFTARSTILNGVEWLKIEKTSSKNIHYFGLGDKSCALDLKGKQLQNWNSDAFGYGKNSDPLYRSIPFYYGLEDGKAYGIFLHNSNRSQFDFDSKRKGSCTIQTAGGEMDYFFIYGPELTTVAGQYMEMTGKPSLPPLWSLGFHQCRWSYFPEKRVIDVANQFREKKIPCDAIYLDIDYMDGYRCFTWNKDYFPNPKKMIKKLSKKGFQTVVMIDPGIRVDPDYEVYADGKEKDVFCRRFDGTIMNGPVWPSDCVWPDFTDPQVRDWWGPLYKDLYVKDGISGFWNDMNEPAVFKVNSLTFPDEVRHDFDGHGADHAKAHNIYGQQMARATYDGLRELQPNKRPFLVTRASFAGGQRFAAVWTGDNLADWEHLRLANIQCQRLSLSGFSFVGTDIGGFAGVPTGELLVRWLQLAVFHPFYRIHSMGNNVDGAAEAEADLIAEAERVNRLDQEPWAFGDPHTDLAREAIEFRYELLPYIYSTFYQHVQDGQPMLKSLSFVDQTDPNTYRRENEFLFGDHILVSPVIRANAKSISTYLPKGQWLDYWTGKGYEGGKRYSIRVKMNSIPLFVRAGAVIPNYPVMQYVGEKPVTEIKLCVYLGSANSQCYLDEGEGYGYEKRQYKLCQYSTQLDEDGSFKLKQRQSGKYKPDCKSYRILLHGLEGEDYRVLVDGKAVTFEVANGVGVLASVPFKFKKLQVVPL